MQLEISDDEDTVMQTGGFGTKLLLHVYTVDVFNIDVQNYVLHLVNWTYYSKSYHIISIVPLEKYKFLLTDSLVK